MASWADREDSTEDLWDQIFKALTLLAPEKDFGEFEAEYLGDQIVGQYNYRTRELSVRVAEGKFDFWAEFTYVHEYAHHVQNESYRFPDIFNCFEADSDARNALSALIEGDAVRTQVGYIEEMIGWDRFDDLAEELDVEEEEPPEETAMRRYRDEQFRFTYSEGPDFVFDIAVISECENCDTERERVDDAFRIPPVTTEQVLYTDKYFDGEGRTRLSLPENLLGDEWEQRFASSVGKSNWIALLVALTGAEAEEIEPENPGWMGDYGVLFEHDDGRALHLQIVQWDNRKYADSLVNALDGRTQLVRTQTRQSSTIDGYYDFYGWHGEAGSIALGVTIDRVDRFRTMFLAVGPDPKTVDNAVRLARESLIIK